MTSLPARQTQRSPTPGREAPDEDDTGRTRWSRKHRDILAAATGLFLSDGYARTSMEAVAERAEVSKATLYKHFGAKAALFEAIVDGLCDELFEPVRRRRDRDEPRDLLLTLARRYLDILLEPTSVGLHRALVADEAVCRELGVRSWEAGAGFAQRELAGHLARWSDEGRLRIKDHELAAEQFFGMVGGHCQLRALLCVADAPADAPVEAELDRRASAAVATFLRAFAPGARPQAN